MTNPTEPPIKSPLIEKLEHEATFMTSQGKAAISRAIEIVRQHEAEPQYERQVADEHTAHERHKHASGYSEEKQDFINAAKRMARGIHFSHTVIEPRCKGCSSCKGNVEELVELAGKKAKIAFKDREQQPGRYSVMGGVRSDAESSPQTVAYNGDNVAPPNPACSEMRVVNEAALRTSAIQTGIQPSDCRAILEAYIAAMGDEGLGTISTVATVSSSPTKPVELTSKDEELSAKVCPESLQDVDELTLCAAQAREELFHDLRIRTDKSSAFDSELMVIPTVHAMELIDQYADCLPFHQGKTAQNDCREAFIKWAESIGLDNMESNFAWFGWQAAWFRRQPEPVSVSLEQCAKAIQERYWKGDIAITISDARVACTAFAKAVLDTAGVKYAD